VRQPGVVAQHEESGHARAKVGCVDCHGADHDAIYADRGRVRESVCARCHEKAVEEFRRSAHHRMRTKAVGAARLLAQVPAMQRRGCLACHDQGAFGEGEAPREDDGRCTACHGPHRFSREQSRSASTCGVCHRGPDHPHVEAWESSKHGAAYAALRDERFAPTCVTCHMVDGSHDVSRGVSLGAVGSGAVLEGEAQPIPMKTISAEAAKAAREEMLVVCLRCHTARTARAALDDADAIKREADRLVAEGAEIVRRLDADGLLVPSPKDRPAHPTAGHALVVGGAMLFEDHSEVERLFFDVAKFAHAITFKAAYHLSPDYVHWLGVARLKAGLEAMKAEDRRVRAPAAAAPRGPAPSAGGDGR
jgi:hydroxylamine dehydrogenase